MLIGFSEILLGKLFIELLSHDQSSSFASKFVIASVAVSLKSYLALHELHLIPNSDKGSVRGALGICMGNTQLKRKRSRGRVRI